MTVTINFSPTGMSAAMYARDPDPEHWTQAVRALLKAGFLPLSEDEDNTMQPDLVLPDNTEVYVWLRRDLLKAPAREDDDEQVNA